MTSITKQQKRRLTDWLIKRRIGKITTHGGTHPQEYAGVKDVRIWKPNVLLCNRSICTTFLFTLTHRAALMTTNVRQLFNAFIVVRQIRHFTQLTKGWVVGGGGEREWWEEVVSVIVNNDKRQSRCKRVSSI